MQKIAKKQKNTKKNVKTQKTLILEGKKSRKKFLEKESRFFLNAKKSKKCKNAKNVKKIQKKQKTFKK